MTVLLKLIYRLNAIPIKTSQCFVGIDHLLLKFIWKGTRTGTAKTILKGKNEVADTTLPDVKVC